ncbi:MAG TPA: hypothetical protein DCZ95_03900 [Verrucomicrobia bacterium]|nr:hypothetical protein [Verrucomicrobiota bacterium]
MGQAKKKQRHCPAVERTISAQECGANRASHYACPASCIYNPWAPANYDKALEINDRVRKKIYDRLIVELRKQGGWASIPEGADESLSSQQFFMSEIHLKKDAGGRTFIERWEAEGFKDLDNDERFLLKQQALIHVAAIEARRIVSEEECEAVDLLDPELKPFIVHDRAFSRRVVRFSHLLGWVFPMPHYHRTFGAAVDIPDVEAMETSDVVIQTARHLGAPADRTELRHWLAENFPRMAASFAAIDTDFRKRMLDVELTSERTDDMAKQIALSEQLDYDAKLVPPEFLEKAPMFITQVSRLPQDFSNMTQADRDAFIRRQYNELFMSSNIPALNQHTPRQAAQIPELRKKLIVLMKKRVRMQDEENRQNGRNEDINWMLKELGLHEIDFAPPPLRPPKEALLEAAFDDDLAAENLPPLPPPSDQPLSDGGLRVDSRRRQGVDRRIGPDRSREIIGRRVIEDGPRLQAQAFRAAAVTSIATRHMSSSRGWAPTKEFTE